MPDRPSLPAATARAGLTNLSPVGRKEFVWFLVLLLAILAVLFSGSFVPGQIMASNDAPLGRMLAECHQLPARFSGCWNDINSVGYREGEVVPDITAALLLVLKPIIFSKFYPALALLILGLGAWCFFRRIGLGFPACAMGTLASVLNASYFSTACWGVGSQTIMIGMTFFALAALADENARRRWLYGVVAGLAVGIAVCEGADIAALFSLCVAAFVMFQAWTAEGPRTKNVAGGVARLAVVTICAMLVAFRAIVGLLAVNVEGISGTDQDIQTREGRWDWSTQWSLPKVETLSLAVPGLFGYRNDSPNGSEYWGAMGRAAAWDRYFANGSQGTLPKGFLRYSGGGFYAGVAVVLLAFWAAAQSFLRDKSVFNPRQRRWLWFWMAIGGISLLLAFGRFAPFYRVVYELFPYSSTVRNPTKFIQVLTFSLLIVFAYGVDGLWRQAMAAGAPARAGWQKAGQFDQN